MIGSKPADVHGVPSERVDHTVRNVVGVAVAALLLRVVYVVVVTRHGDLGLEGDAFSYSSVAGNLGPGSWFVDPFTGRPIADHPPLTVLVLAPIAQIFDSYAAQRLLMACIGAAAVLVLGLVGRMVGGSRVAVGVAVVAALNPNLWVNDGLVMSETPSTLMVALLLLVGVWLSRGPTLARVAVAGAVCGVAALTRAELALFLPFMVVPLVVSSRGTPTSRRALQVAMAGVVMAATIAPWSVWNSTRFDNPVLISTNDGTVLAGANCPDTYGGTNLGGWSFDCVAAIDVAGLDASQASARQRREGAEYVREHAGRAAVVALAREARSVGLVHPSTMAADNRFEGRRVWATWLCFAAFWALVVPAVAGARILRRRGQTLIPYAACAATAVVVIAVTHGGPRLRLPLDVAMCVLAGAALTTWFSRRSSRTGGAATQRSTIGDFYERS